MAARWYALAAAATLAVAACSEPAPESTTGPQFVGGPSAGPCDISNSVVNAYFPPSRQSFINSLKQSMANAGHGTNDARVFGFQIMDSIGSVSRNFSVTPSAGAELTVALIGCMFDESATFTYPPEGQLQAFTNALTSANGGAYYVRGGGANGADATGRSSPILGRITPPGGADGNLSGVAPSSGTWTNMLAISQTLGKHVEQGVLFYGYPVGNPADEVFEWATVPSALTFSPGAVFTVCDFAGASTSTTMVHESGVGVLSFVTSGICDTPQQPLTFLEQGWGPKTLAARLAQAITGALTPTPLQAAVLAGRTGGVSTAPKSRFKKNLVNAALSMDWTPGGNPGDPSTWNGTTAAQARQTSAIVSAVTDDGNLSVRFCAYLTGINNNGTPTKLVKVSDPQRDPECTSPPNEDPNALSVITTRVDDTQSIADFGKVYVTKTGNIIITLAVVSGATAQGSLVTQANVKPASKK
jgi:hypothetical protein